MVLPAPQGKTMTPLPPRSDPARWKAEVVDPVGEERARDPVARQPLRRGPVEAGADQVVAFLGQRHAPVAVRQPSDLREDAVGDGILRVLAQRADHRGGGKARGPRVPDGERRQPIGVHVLRALDQLGERVERFTGRLRPRRMSLQQHRVVALDRGGDAVVG